MIDDAALAEAIRKIRKLRLIDHVPIKDSPPPAVTFLAVMQSGLGGCYQDAALEYIFRHFLKYYEKAAASSRPDNDPISLKRQAAEELDRQAAVVSRPHQSTPEK